MDFMCLGREAYLFLLVDQTIEIPPLGDLVPE